MFQQCQNKLTPNQKGILLALISTAMFTFVGVLVRTLSKDIDPFQILFFRQVVFVFLLLPSMTKNISVLLKPTHKGLHVMRITGAFIALYCGFLTVSNIPFADATALGFIQVLFVALISRFFLYEIISKERVFTIIVGFAGVMLVVQPSFDNSHVFYIFSGILGAFGAAIAVICVRKVAQVEPKITLLAYQAIFVGLLAVIPALNTWQWPNLEQLSLLILVGVISSLAQWVGVSAYKYGQANIIANVEYTKIIYSLLFGYYLFSEVPNQYAILGAIMIILSALLPYIYKTKITSKET
ncbi:hypothetical protein A9264_01960 [Vibrio sp. UCD-FRSSP16_10]|nr:MULTISPECIES: DMT family transporter [unclassified Vibrio]OBT14035.1 hypothetical protein A9260_03410 [Vibrio sp. UCD-FRSSP16_30]OBT22916.1 hypothetical protein A9264_01960 [Vibrio sp. UCD-FRSSP16_10]